MNVQLAVAQSFALLYRSHSVTIRRRKNAVADSCSAPLPIRWGEGIELLRWSMPDGRTRPTPRSFPSPHRMGRGLGIGATFTLLLGRFTICGVAARSETLDNCNALPTASRRYSRVKLCATNASTFQRNSGSAGIAVAYGRTAAGEEHL